MSEDKPIQNGNGQHLLVTEQFYSLQGEGRTLGKPSHFIRLFGCNFACKWCDSRYSWAPESRDSAAWKTPRDIVENIPSSSNVVITGGEPLLWMGKPAWNALLLELSGKRCTIEVETCGAFPPDFETLDRVTQWNISPKLLSAGAKESEESSIYNLCFFLERVRSKTNFNWQLKFVVSDDADWARFQYVIERLTSTWFLTPELIKKHVYVMPECKTREEHLEKQEWLIKKVKEDGRVNFTSRLQVLVWDRMKSV